MLTVKELKEIMAEFSLVHDLPYNGRLILFDNGRVCMRVEVTEDYKDVTAISFARAYIHTNDSYLFGSYDFYGTTKIDLDKYIKMDEPKYDKNYVRQRIIKMKWFYDKSMEILPQLNKIISDNINHDDLIKILEEKNALIKEQNEG